MTTMSSAPKLDAKTAGACVRAMRASVAAASVALMRLPASQPHAGETTARERG